MENQYTDLFPYEKIPYGSKILIYGAGDVGQEYLRQMLLTQYCEVIGFVDRAHDKIPPMVVPVMHRIKSLNWHSIMWYWRSKWGDVREPINGAQYIA